MSAFKTWIRRTCMSATAIVITGAVLSPAHAYQQDYRFTYSKLYTQLKHNAEEGHDSAKVGVFFVSAENGLPCELDKAWMEKEEKYEVLKVAANGELQLPIDSHLRQANPLVFIEIDQEVQCDFSMVVMSKSALSGRVDYLQLITLQSDMQKLLGDLGGMFARWFTPDVEGVTLEFAESQGKITLSSGQTLPIENHRVSVDIRKLAKGDSIELPYETLRVMPYIPKAG